MAKTPKEAIRTIKEIARRCNFFTPKRQITNKEKANAYPWPLQKIAIVGDKIMKNRSRFIKIRVEANSLAISETGLYEFAIINAPSITIN